MLRERGGLTVRSVVIGLVFTLKLARDFTSAGIRLAPAPSPAFLLSLWSALVSVHHGPNPCAIE